MSTFEHVALQHAAPYGLNDPLTVGLPRRITGIVAHLRSEIWVVRVAVCCGFLGAVLAQVGLFSLIAQLVLMLDTSVLPSLTASFYCFSLGAAIMLASRSLSVAGPTAAFR
jgi:hypothetical protein